MLKWLRGCFSGSQWIDLAIRTIILHAELLPVDCPLCCNLSASLQMLHLQKVKSSYRNKIQNELITESSWNQTSCCKEDTHQTDERVILECWAGRGRDDTCSEEDALLLQKLLDAAHVGVKSVQVPQLPVLFLWAADKQQQLPDLSPDKRCLLNHQVLWKWKGKNK